ncbi:hypothetical protein [Sporosarcina cascadiensis]|uniref:hypothetical protein n=1 Tax=Sporosarcina cascadiensis TaxID=2660747 RepID=UPI00129B6FA3|nr:hypothetical protein [Sporosarcina cascadiensis]
MYRSTKKELHTYNPSWKHWTVVSLPILSRHMKFQVAKDKYKQFQIAKKLICRASTVINGCDVDVSLSKLVYINL